MTELKPCPFCGCSVFKVKPTYMNAVGYISDWVVECIDCMASGPPSETEYEARAKWNTRTLETE